MTVPGTVALGPPTAVTIVMDDAGGTNDVLITDWPNDLDDLGQWMLQVDIGAGFNDLQAVNATAANLAAQPMWPGLTIAGFDYRVVEIGGNVQYSGSSDPSNVVTAL